MSSSSSSHLSTVAEAAGQNLVDGAPVSPYKAPKLYTLASGQTFLAHDSKGFLEAFRNASLDSLLLEDVWPRDCIPEELSAKEFAEVLREGLLRHLNINLRTHRGIEVFVNDLKAKGILVSVKRVN